MNDGLPVSVHAAIDSPAVTRGLAFDRCDVATITNLGPDRIGEHGIDTMEQMARVKGRVLSLARKTVVLNADDPRVLSQGRSCSAPRAILFSASGRTEAVDAHLRTGGEALVLEKRRDGMTEIVLVSATARTGLAVAEALPATFRGRAMHNAANALCAAALAIGMGQNLDVIRGGLGGFKPDMEELPSVPPSSMVAPSRASSHTPQRSAES